MTDEAGDGWEGKETGTWAQWSGFGQIFFMDETEPNLCREDSYAGSPYAFCSQRTETFVVQALEAFIVYEKVGWCQSDLNEMVWEGMLDGEGLLDGEDNRTIAGGGLTADDCWTACQAENPVEGEFHEFGNDGKVTWCFCQSGCKSMNDVGESNTLAPPNWKAPSACVIDVKTVSSTIICSEGSYPDEIGWSLSCSDGTTLSGLGEAWGGLTLGSVEEGKALAVELDAACTLEMTGTMEDSWESAVWSGFGQSFSIVTGDESYTVLLDTTYIKTIDFVVQAPEDVVDSVSINGDLALLPTWR